MTNFLNLELNFEIFLRGKKNCTIMLRDFGEGKGGYIDARKINK